MSVNGEILVKTVSPQEYMKTMIGNRIVQLAQIIDRLEAAREMTPDQLEEWYDENAEKFGLPDK